MDDFKFCFRCGNPLKYNVQICEKCGGVNNMYTLLHSTFVLEILRMFQSSKFTIFFKWFKANFVCYLIFIAIGIVLLCNFGFLIGIEDVYNDAGILKIPMGATFFSWLVLIVVSTIVVMMQTVTALGNLKKFADAGETTGVLHSIAGLIPVFRLKQKFNIAVLSLSAVLSAMSLYTYCQSFEKGFSTDTITLFVASILCVFYFLLKTFSASNGIKCICQLSGKNKKFLLKRFNYAKIFAWLSTVLNAFLFVLCVCGVFISIWMVASATQKTSGLAVASAMVMLLSLAPIGYSFTAMGVQLQLAVAINSLRKTVLCVTDEITHGDNTEVNN